MKIAVIGAGPAGLTLARALEGEVVVYERERSLASKPCSWVVLDTGEVPLRRREILFKIKRYRIFLDGRLIHELESKRPFAYVIDKREFLERLAEGLEVRMGFYAMIKGNAVISNGREEKYDAVYDARGYQALDPSDTALAIQYETDYRAEEDTLNTYFFSDITGYAWVFPGPYGARIGIGGKAGYDELVGRLKKLLLGNVVKYGVARVSMGGLKVSKYKVGEAAGAVMPITGEGIRPSIVHARLIARGNDVTKSALYRAISAQVEVMREAEGTGRPGEVISKVFIGNK
ncbi:MAG: NAD(P)/FAD-dependent oxidoreductase [Thermoprotei archaeon]